MDRLQRVALGEDARIQDQRQQRVTDSGSQQMAGNSPHLDFQDSNLSPALSLLPSNSGLEHNFSEYSLFQHSEMEFVPLRAYPDISMASERFHIPPQDLTTRTMERASLSQHPLAQENSVLSEEGASGFSSLSQHSLSPELDATKEERVHSPMASITEKGLESSSKVVISKSVEMVTDSDTYFLNKDVPAQHLMRILQKDVGMLSSSADSSASDTSGKKELKNTDNPTSQGLIREGPPGEASVSQQQPQPERDSYLNESKSRLSEVFNVTVGSRSTQPDDSSEALRKELLHEAQKRSSHEAGQEQKSATPPLEFRTDISERKPSVTRVSLGNASWTGLVSTTVQQRHSDQALWLSENQTGIDGSYLGFLPQSQSTPGVFKPPCKSSVKAKFHQLSDIDSNKETSVQSHAEPSTSQAAAPHPEPENQSQKEPTCDKVQSLPSLTYMQKVDAWRANQSPGKTSLFDTLALHGFTGVSPKKKAYDAVSDNLNRILSQQVAKISPVVPQNTSTGVSGSSSPRREEAVGSAPSDKDNTWSAATQPASPLGRSQSHSSLSTVVMSVKKEQPEGRTEKEHTQAAEEVLQPPNTRPKLSPLVVSLGHFSDVTFSNSQGSSNSGHKLATSIGTSSVSLEVDNYDPYWTSKLSTPPPQHKTRDLNIEERIPLYLQNLGIDQSPSTILTPFTPRGPIREPEFSPTELCTIKGSTPTRSIQPSDGGTPHKAEFSRSSIQSVDSSLSIPLSQDSFSQALGPGLIRPASSSSETAAIQSDFKLYPNRDEDPSSQLQRDSSQSPDHSGSALAQAEDLESHQMGQNGEQNAEVSLVSSNAFSDIRKLLTQAEDMVSSRSSAASDRFLSQRKASPSTSLFTTEESKTQSSQLWARSSSDSVLTSRQLTVGENIPPATKQSGVVSRSVGLSLVLNKSVQRAEPEGCSAAPPDRAPPQPPVTPPPPSPPTVTTSISEEPKQTTQEGPEESSTSSPVPVDVMSDRSSDSSLAIRVAKLLQSESPATVVSSATSVDQEEGRAREWIKQIISGQQCEPLELDQEDRRRIEEIKRELLLKKPLKSYPSTDTESSAASSLRDQRGQTPLVETLSKILDTITQSFQQPQSLSTKLPQPNTAQGEDIEARVREIAAREGVPLPNTRALTSITISTCRRSASPSTSTSPVSLTTELLHLNQLTSEDNNKQPSSAPTEEEFGKHPETDVVLGSVSPVRQDTVGGPYEESSSSSLSSEQDKIKEGYSELIKRAEKSSITDSSLVGHETEQATTKTGHISHVRLTLSPKPTDHALDSFSRDVTLPQKHIVPLGHSLSAPSSPDEGVGLSSPPEWHESREQITPRRTDTGESVTQQQRMRSSIEVSVKPLAFEALVPHLLPYKPPGSELFYVPQAEADFSSTDTTIESTHTGSDDALPPQFSSDVFGHQDPGLDRGVTIRHTEGIYSKRLSKPRFLMHAPGHRGSSDATNEPSSNSSQTPEPTSQVAFTRVPLSSNTEAPATSRRDQGTSPVLFLTYDPPEMNRDRSVHLETHSNDQLKRDQGVLTSMSRRDQGTSPVLFLSYDPPETNRDCSVHLETHSNDQLKRDQGVLTSTSRQNNSTLDELWLRFRERWSQEGSRPISDREASLLERLERLSRLIHSTRNSTVSDKESQQELHTPHKGDFRELRKHRHIPDKTNQITWEYREGLGQVEGDSQLSSPAERDASDTLSSTPGSMSTVDTARLVRAFGADRVQKNLRTSSSLSKLYTAIDKQKDGQDLRRTSHTAVVPVSETSGTDESSVVVDPASSTSTYTPPSHRGPSTSLVSKKAVRQVSRGIQAGHLEIVSNGTRRHTRDVGTTFPSPSDARGPTQSSTSSSLGGAQNAQRSLSSKTQKQRKNQKSSSKHYPEGISWFIPADELKAEARKENEPEEVSVWRANSVWFEPLQKHPWREPLRQRQVQDERNTQRSESDPGPRGKISSSLARVSLQDALLASCPEFVSRSRQRMERLALQVEERRLQVMFSSEREQFFSRPGRPGRLSRPAGTALLRRAVPKKEMIQRSKQIYENLPEVRRRKEEERRRAEYRSYRLNAQLYNKRITNRVLGRRTAWH